LIILLTRNKAAIFRLKTLSKKIHPSLYGDENEKPNNSQKMAILSLTPALL